MSTAEQNSQEKSNKAVLIASIVIVAVILLVSCLVLLIRGQKEATGAVAKIYRDGELLQEIDLSTVSESYTFTVEGDDGAYNIIEVRPGEIGIIEASCPDHICIDTGFIKDGTIPVVCLPNKIIIEVTDENASDSIDGVAS